MKINEIIDKLHEADFLYLRRGSNLNQVQP